jgi:hypothetical protein
MKYFTSPASKTLKYYPLHQVNQPNGLELHELF